MGNTMPATVAGFGDLLGRVDGGLHELERLVRRIFADCERLLPFLGPLAARVKQLLDQLGSLVKRLFEEVRKYLDAPGDPIKLWQHGNTWNNHVALHASNPVGTVTIDFMHSDDKWHGPAATAYQGALPPQKTALERTQTIAQQLGDSLHDVAVRLGMFWAGLAAAAISLAAEMLTAAGMTATVLAAPTGLTVAAVSTSKFLAIMSGLVVAVSTALTTILQAQARLNQQLNDNAAFPGPGPGHWPAATTSQLSDASMSDGNPSDWRLQP